MSARVIVGIFATTIGSAAHAQSLPAQQTAFSAAAIDRIVRSEVDSGFSGVVLVAQGDSIVLRRAYSRPGHSLSAESVFWIASITKSFTALTVLTLEQQGRLSVHDSLGHFFATAPADKRGISLHQLLTHTAGFGNAEVTGAISNRDAAVRAILAESLTYQPGHGYNYNNGDYQLLAAVIEVVTNGSWQQAVRKEVLEPAGLRHTGFQSVTDWAHRGSNGMSATADDLLRWIRVLEQHEGFGAPGGSALKAPHVVVRHEDPYDIAYGYGMRLYLLGDRITEVAHSGSGDNGHSAIVRHLESGVTIIVLSDAGFHGSGTWSGFLATLLSPRQ